MDGTLDILDKCSTYLTYIGEEGEVGDGPEDGLPESDVLRPQRQLPPLRRHHLVRVQPDLDDVVDEREERRQRERSHEQRYEAVLDHCKEMFQ